MKKKQTKNLVIVSIVLLCLLMGAMGIYIWKLKGNPTFSLGEFQLDLSQEINGAMDRLEDGEGPSDIVSDIDTIEKVTAITFIDLSDKDTDERILKLLSKYDKRATFMLSGISAAEDSGFVKKLANEGHRIGSIGLSGDKHLEKFSSGELINSFIKTNHIINSIVNRHPNILQPLSSNLTEELLKIASSCGYEYVVDSKNFINYQSFASYEQVLDYIQGLKRGSIITIKTEGSLDDMEYTKEIDEIITKEEVENQLHEDLKGDKSQEESLVQIIEWLFMAMDEIGYETVFPEELSQYNDMDFSMDFTDLRKKNGGKLAKIYKSVNILENEVGISFRGISNKENLESILKLLKENRIKATFFVTGMELQDHEDSIRKILLDGHEIGNGGLTGSDLISLDFSQICFEIYKTDRLLREKYGVFSHQFMPAYGKYNDLVLEAASALSYDVVTYNKNPIIDDRPAKKVMEYFKGGIKKGDIIHIRLDISSEVIEAMEDILELINIKNYGISPIGKLLKKHIEYGKPYYNSSRDIGVSPKKSPKEKGLGETNKDKGKKIDFAKIKAENGGKLAPIINSVYTTSQKLSFTFYGIHEKKVLYDVLDKMDEIDAKGTFFVTNNNVYNNKEDIEKIINRGHEIGICLTENIGTDFASIYSSIKDLQDKLKYDFGIRPNLVRYPYTVNVTGEMLEAFSSTGSTLVWQDMALASSKVGPEGDLSDIMAKVFHDGYLFARRGSIIYFRLDYYKNPQLIGNLILDIYKNQIAPIAYEDGIKDNGTGYKIVSLGDLISSEGVYKYPVNPKNYKDGKSSIGYGHMKSLDEDKRFQYMQGRYVGTPTSTTENMLPEFSEYELKQIDKTGRFTDDKVLFLTFDDWGSDKSINQILYVLRKHNIKASFFVRTNYIESNPNILRAIALEGHDIGSHSDVHYPFANSEAYKEGDEKKTKYTPLTEGEISVRKDDLLLSYNKLRSIVGDVLMDGRPALTKIFRPPTLAMSKGGMEAIFDMGFDYIVSGDFSTHDYEAEDEKELVNTILKGLVRSDGTIYPLQNGSILVLHMLDNPAAPATNPNITAKALDAAIPTLLKQGYKFDKLSSYLPENKGSIYTLEDEYGK